MRSRLYIVCLTVMFGVLVTTVPPASAQESQENTCTSRYQGRKLDPKTLSAVLADRQERPGSIAPSRPIIIPLSSFIPPRRIGLPGIIVLKKAGFPFSLRAGPPPDFLDPSPSRANVCGADLTNANLQEATLRGANLQEADLSGAFLRAATFEPRPGGLPDMNSVLFISTYGLEEITFSSEPYALVAMREAFKKAGMREQERQLTSAIERRRREIAWEKSWGADTVEAGLKYILFEVTCHYGLLPGRPLRILGVFLVVFSIPYLFALKARGRAGIWAIWLPDRVHKTEGQETPVRVTDAFSFSRWAGTRWETPVRWLRAFGVALYFSLLSAVHIGWRDLNVGTWIARMQPREYTLRATGWVRFVSGLQSLLSVYLIALAVLTYFGRPFE